MPTLQLHEKLFQGVQVAVEVAVDLSEAGDGVLTSAVNAAGDALRTEALEQRSHQLGT